MTIRAATLADAPAIAAIYRHWIGVGAVSFETEAPDAAAMAARIAAAGRDYPWLVDEAEGRIAGYAYAGAFSPRDAYRYTVETTIYLAADACGRGVGRGLYAALLGGLTAQGFAQAIGRIALPNPPSVALHAALGFREVGVLPAAGWKAGRWVDVGLWQRPLADATPPGALRPV